MPKKKPVDLFEEATPGVGHNGVNSKVLLSYIERVENVNGEIDALREDVKSIFEEAKGAGLDTKTIRKVIKIRQMDRDKWLEEQAQLDLYLASLGLL